MSTLATTNIKHPSSASNNIVLDASGNVVLQAGSASTPALQPSGDINTGIFFPAADTIAFAEGGVEAARIDSSGRLLVGTSTARSNFNWDGGGRTPQIQLETSVNNYTGLSLVNNTVYPPTLFFGGSNTGVGSSGNTIVTNGRSVGTILFGGADGTNILSAASIEGLIDGTPGTNDMPGRLVFSTTADGASSPTERMRITQAGYINTYSTANGLIANVSAGAGTTTFIYAGNRSSTDTQGSGATTVYYVYSNGTVQNATGTYTTISDVKLKENIVDANSQWDDLKAIQIRNWNFKAETGHETHRQIGPIAQELETVCPGLVFETSDRDTDGNETGEVTKGVNQSVLYMKAVKALQEAMERIETLESEMATVKAQLS